MSGRSFFIVTSLLYLLFTMLSVIYGSVGFRVVAACLGCMVFLYMVFGVSEKSLSGFNRFYTLGVFLFIIVLLFCFSLLSFQSSGGRSVFSVLVFIGALGISWFSLERHATVYLYEFPFYFILTITLFLFIGLGYGPAEFNTVLQGYSRNGYSAILLAFSSGYIFSRIYRGRNVSLFLMVLVFILSFPLYGRSGIAMAFTLLITVLFYRNTSFAIFLSVIGCLIGFFCVDTVEGYFLSATNFSSGVDSPRSEMLVQYIEKIDVVGFFLGVDLERIPVIVAYNGNPHNAFVLLHSYYGIAMLPLMGLFSISCFMLFLDKRYVLLIVAILFLVRAFFDVIYLFGLFDYLFFPLLFYAVFSRLFWRSSILSSAPRCEV